MLMPIALHRWKALAALLMLPLLSAMAEPVAQTTSVGSSADISLAMIGPGLRATDLDRSIKFYTNGLGMVEMTRLVHGSVTEVMLGFKGSRTPPIIMLFKDAAPGKSPPIVLGNGFGRVMLRVSDAAALSARLTAVGYATSEVHDEPANHVKVFWVDDPDGYRYEITERSTPGT